MPIKIYNPTSPGRRNSSVLDYGHLTKKRPEKSLVESLPAEAPAAPAPAPAPLGQDDVPVPGTEPQAPASDK